MKSSAIISFLLFLLPCTTAYSTDEIELNAAVDALEEPPQVQHERGIWEDSEGEESFESHLASAAESRRREARVFTTLSVTTGLAGVSLFLAGIVRSNKEECVAAGGSEETPARLDCRQGGPEAGLPFWAAGGGSILLAVAFGLVSGTIWGRAKVINQYLDSTKKTSLTVGPVANTDIGLSMNLEF